MPQNLELVECGSHWSCLLSHEMPPTLLPLTWLPPVMPPLQEAPPTQLPSTLTWPPPDHALPSRDASHTASIFPDMATTSHTPSLRDASHTASIKPNMATAGHTPSFRDASHTASIKPNMATAGHAPSIRDTSHTASITPNMATASHAPPQEAPPTLLPSTFGVWLLLVMPHHPGSTSHNASSYLVAP